MQNKLQKALEYLWRWKYMTNKDIIEFTGTNHPTKYVQILNDRGFIGLKNKVKPRSGESYTEYWIKEGLTEDMIDFDKVRRMG